MNIDKRWYLLLVAAASAAAGAIVASTSHRRRHRRNSHDRDYKAELHAWENEGGNLPPVPAAPVLP